MSQTNWLLRGLLAAVLGHALTVGGAARADEFDTMRAKWAVRGGVADAGDPDVAAQIAVSEALAQEAWDTMIRTEGRTALWPTLTNFAVSATITNTFGRLATLASAYYNGPASLKNNPQVLAAVQSGIEWLVANHYNTGKTEYGNWYDWQIGSPQHLNNLVFLLYNDQTPAQRAALLAIVDRFVPDPTRRLNRDGSVSGTVEISANLLDKAYVVAMRGMLGKDAARLAKGRDALSLALPYVTTSDGFYQDGTFVQHYYVPYAGGYGTVVLANIGRLYYLLDGSSWAVTDPNKGLVFDWVMHSYRPFIYDGAMMDNQRGRGITRQASTDHVVGRGIVANLLALSDSLPAAQSDQVKALMKGWMRRDTTFGPSYFSALRIGTTGAMAMLGPKDITRLKAILEDPAIPALAEAVETKVYPSGDRAVQRRPGHAYVVSMFSNRISALESGNGENLNGWWTGMGMTSLYNADQDQYSGNYWATTNMWRLPGTTTDHSGSGKPVDWKNYDNTQSGVGGAQLDGLYAAVGMDFATRNVTGSALTGKKAWFLLGDKVVAVGAGIATTDGRSVETIVENRKLDEGGGNTLTVNGSTQAAAIPWAATLPAVGWAHLAGSVGGADIGYVFPDRPAVAALRERRSSQWRNVTTGGETAEVADHYLSLALEHGVNPASAAYTYIVLPNRSAADTAAFAANPGITVLERSVSATAVKDTAQGVTGLVFWNDASKTVHANGAPLVTSDRKAAVVLKQEGPDLRVSVADPTQLNAGSVNLDINRAATGIVTQDPGVTVLQLSPTIKLRVAVNGAAGKSYGARFTLNPVASLAPAADAYVRDGASASTNFGAASVITVKNDAAGYARTGLLKFDLSGVEGTIVSASLRLMPTSVGMTGIGHKLFLSDAASWSEGTVTWNNRPANGGVVANWTVPAAGTPVNVDVTSAVVTAMGADKQLSFGVEAAANLGASGFVDYASRTHATPGSRPTLVVTVE